MGFNEDIKAATLGLVHRFSAVAPIVAAAPAPCVAPPESVPAPPPPAMVAFYADAMFDFDSATLKPADKQALNSFTEDSKGAGFPLRSER